MILDGHCRLKAYRKAGCGGETQIPMVHFEGTVMETRLRSASENSKAKLSLSKEEELEATWRLMKDRAGRGEPLTMRSEMLPRSPKGRSRT